MSECSRDHTHLLHQEAVQFSMAVFQPSSVCTVYHPHHSVCRLKVVPPVGPQRPLSTHIPDIQCQSGPKMNHIANTKYMYMYLVPVWTKDEPHRNIHSARLGRKWYYDQQQTKLWQNSYCSHATRSHFRCKYIVLTTVHSMYALNFFFF